MTTTITCPSCGTAAALDRLNRTAEEFCRKCDYPLFWAPVPATIASMTGDDEATAETTLRRLPGANGRRAVASVPCPICSELNTPTALVCHRCSGPMVVQEPEPEPEPEPEEEPIQEAPEMVEIPEERSNLWWWVALGVGLFLVTILVVLLAR